MIWGMFAMQYPLAREAMAPFLRSFADRSHGRVTVYDLERRILGCDAQVWVVDDFKAVCITSVGAQTVTLDFCSGTDREEWQDELEATVADWAESLGKRWIMIAGRPGWSKWARGRGYVPAHIEMVKELAHGR